MNGRSILLLMSIFPAMQGYANSQVGGQTDSLTITVTKVDVNDTRLMLTYEIRNASEQEVWICDTMGFEEAYNSEIFVSQDDQLVTLRRRLDVPTGIVWSSRPRAKYVRLPAGEKWRESLSILVPVANSYIIGKGPPPRGLCYASRLAIEIGYYEGNLPQRLLRLIQEAQEASDSSTGSRPAVLEAFGDALSFNYSRERLPNRDEEIVIPYTYQQLEGEKVLHTTIDGLRIPCQRGPELAGVDAERLSRPDFGPDLKTCTRLEIRFRPTALEYLFPSPMEQSLLGRGEIESLRSAHTFTVQHESTLQSFARQILRGYPSRPVVRESRVVHFDCYDHNDHLVSFDMYGDMIVETTEDKRLIYLPGSVSIATLLPEIRKLEHRVQCAVNLRDLYHRLRRYNLTVNGREKGSPSLDVVVYPTAAGWFDAITSSGPFPRSVMRVFWLPKFGKPHVCPSVREGKSTYAMNPACQPNSPPDTVLLFETKPGWNQHGGPELFTLDNHDPKGGLVLLNDGTVKFIRTEEELQQLRWK